MIPAVGSPANVPCPKCRSTKVKVALHTPPLVFCRCSLCGHVWATTQREKKAA